MYKCNKCESEWELGEGIKETATCRFCGSSLENTSSEMENLFIFLREKFNLKLAKCVAGQFVMGSPDGEYGRFQDEPQHNVTISKDFYIGIYPVTQALYESVMGENPSKFRCNDNPVESVTWKMSKEFCEKLNEKTDFIRPADYMFDLPTEAQWEYACRANSKTSLNIGYDVNYEKNDPNLERVGWYSSNSSNKSQPVGKKAPNAWGIYDMHGNVWEWCRDECNTENTDCICRGGSWINFARFCRSACRSSLGNNNRSSDVGFRVALVPVLK